MGVRGGCGGDRDASKEVSSRLSIDVNFFVVEIVPRSLRSEPTKGIGSPVRMNTGEMISVWKSLQEHGRKFREAGSERQKYEKAFAV